MTEYVIIYERGENGEWGASCPDVPGCVAAGESQAEVEQLMRESGDPVPEPHHLAGVIAA